MAGFYPIFKNNNWKSDFLGLIVNGRYVCMITSVYMTRLAHFFAVMKLQCKRIKKMKFLWNCPYPGKNFSTRRYRRLHHRIQPEYQLFYYLGGTKLSRSSSNLSNQPVHIHDSHQYGFAPISSSQWKSTFLIINIFPSCRCFRMIHCLWLQLTILPQHWSNLFLGLVGYQGSQRLM